jgi:hypothetical protein
MSTDQPTRRSPGIWRAMRRAARALGRIHSEQAHMWDTWVQAHRAAVPEEGPLTWVLALDGYRLAGCRLPVASDPATEEMP